jgi:predicted nucleotidyltransferase
MLFHTLDAVLGSTAKVRIVRALIPLTSPVSGNELRALARIRSKSGLKTALNDLTELGILEREDTRRIRLYRINRRHDLAEPLATLFRAESMRIGRLRDALQEILEAGAVQEHTLSIILFGSNARGEARPTSDVDLLVVTRAEPADQVRDVLMDAVPETERRFGLRISPLLLSKERVQERYRDGDPLMQNIHVDGRTLYGTHFQELVGVW